MHHQTFDMRYLLTIKGRIVIAMLLFLTVPQTGTAQSVTLRNNLLYDATLTPNLGLEIRTSTHWTLGVNVGVNAWDIDKETNKKWRHFLISPNVRRYFYQKQDTLRIRLANYLEIDGIYSHFNVGNTKIPFGLYKAVQEQRLQGDLVALGAKYGYSWILSRDWRIEAEAGVAVGYAWFKEYDCPHCGTYLGKDDRIFLLPQLGVNVVYIIN